jgi:RpiR family carbohydrate utilization transcriptional regulator
VNETSMTPGVTRIKQHYPLMSAQEKRVADYVLSNISGVLSMPTSEIAKRAGTGTATVVRFCRSIGFSGVSDFKHYLKSAQLSSDGPWSSFDRADTIAQIAVKTMDYNKRAIDETLMVLSVDAVEAAADAIAKAGRFVIFSEGSSGATATCAYSAFLQIGIPCSLVTDAFFQVSEAASLRPGDVALSVCHSGRARGAVDSIRLAKEAGATTVSIVGIVGSALTKVSDIILYTGLADNNFYSDTMAVRICELNVISVLHTALALRNKDKLGDFTSKNSDLFEIKRYQK